MNGDVSNVQSPSVIFFNNGHGDHITALPAIRAFSGLLPHSILICAFGAGELYFSDVGCQEYFEINFWTDGRCRYFDPSQVSQHLSSCDVFVSLVPWHSAELAALVSKLRPKTSIGFHPTFSKYLLWDPSMHVIRMTFAATSLLTSGISMSGFTSPPRRRLQDIFFADSMMSEIPADYRVLALHTETQPNKMWSVKSFEKVLEIFLKRFPNYFVILIAQRASDLSRLINHCRCVPCIGVDIGAAYALLARSHLFLGVDSCMLHMADLCRIPGVGLFGATASATFGFLFSPHIHIERRSMSQIEPDEVVQALTLLAGVSPTLRLSN